MSTAVDLETGEKVSTVVLMDETEARKITADIKAWAGTLWLKLKQAHDGQAWRAMGYGSWRDYIEAEFDMGRSYAYRLVAHASAVYELAEAAGVDPEEVSPAGDTLTERETRRIDVPKVAGAIADATRDLPVDATRERAKLANEMARQEAEAEAKRKAREKHAAAQAAASGSVPDASEPTEDALHGDPATAGEDGPEAGNPPPASGPLVVSDETERAMFRAAVAKAIAKTSDFLELDPAQVVAAMDDENRESWCAFADDLDDWHHRFFAAHKEATTLRSVK